MTDTLSTGALTQGAPSYQEVLGARESSNNYQAVNQLGYLGKYQMGGMALQDIGYKDAQGNWTGKNGINSPQDFLASPSVQEQAQMELMDKQDSYISNYGTDKFIGTIFQGIPVTQEGLRAASHLVGAKAVDNMLRTGEVPQDANGVKAIEYLQLGASISPTSKPAPAATVGEQKQQRLQEVSKTKQETLATKSESKQLEISGLSEAEQNILNQGMSSYVRNGTTGTAASRAEEFLAAQDKLSAIQQRKVEEDSNVIFEDLDNPLQYTGNTLLSTVNTIGNLAGGLVSIPSSIRAAYNLSDATNEGFEKYQSIIAKQQAGLNLSPSEREFANTDEFVNISQGMESMANAQSIQDSFGILGDYVNTELTDDFVKEGVSIFNEVVNRDLTLGEFVSESVNLLTSSPGALGQASVESLPYVLASTYSLPLTVASGWANNQQEALDEFQKNNDGDIPTGQELANVVMLSGAQALVDHFGDRLVGGRGLRNALKRVAGTRASDAVTHVVTGTAGEFVAEGGAEILGQLAASAGQGNVDLAQAYASGLLGAGAGGTTSGAISAANLSVEALDNIPESSGSMTGVLGRARDAVTSAATTARETVSQAAEVAQEPTETTTTTEQATTAEEAPEADLDVRLAQAFTESDANPDRAQEIEAPVREEYNSLKQEAMAIVQSGVTDETITPEQQEVLGRFGEAQKVIRARNKEIKSRDTARQANQLATASTNSPAVQSAVSNVLGSIELDPEAITADQATAILGNNNIRLNTEQRSKLEHHVRVAKSMEEVGKEVQFGGNGNIGINQYLEEVGAALEINDVATANESLDALKSWQQQHVTKLQSNVHNGKPMTARLRATVAKEIKAMNAAVAKLENDLLYVDAPTQEEQANVANNAINTNDTSSNTAVDTERQVELVEKYSTSELRSNPDKIYVFGDNTLRKGKGGQAAIRDESNAMGIATKLLPSRKDNAYFTDDQFEQNKSIIDADIKAIKDASQGKTVVLPTGGLGTGLSDLGNKAPRTAAYLNKALKDAFGYDNPLGVAEQQAPETALAVEDAPVAEASVSTEEVTTELKEIFKELDSDPAIVDQVVNDVLALNEEGVQFDTALAGLREQYGQNTIDAAVDSLSKLFPSTRDSLAGRMTTPEGGGLKVPVKPEGQDARKFARSYNWIQAYYIPKTSKGNILQSVPNLISGQTATSIANFIGRDLTNDEAALVKDFKTKHASFKKVFDQLFDANPKKRDFRDNDPQLYLADFNEENISTAVWTAIYNWIATRGGDTFINDSPTINTMVGRDTKADVPYELYNLLGKVGVGRNTLSETLGRDIMNLLHIQTTGQAPHHLDSKMTNSVGQLALTVMKDMKVLTTSVVEAKELAKFNPKATQEDLKSNVKLNFYRIKTKLNSEGKEKVVKPLRDIATTLRQANLSVDKTSDRMWANAFGDISKRKEPSFEPIKKVAKKVKGSDQKITKAEQEILRKDQNRKHFIRDDEWAAFNALGLDNMAKILGDKPKSEVHVTMRDRQVNINENIQRELGNFQEFVHMRDESGKEHFYFEHSKWTNGRYGIESTLVNPQGIKSHRAFIGQEGWVTTIDPKANNRWFWAAMKEPLGIKSAEGIDAEMQQVIDILKGFLEEGEIDENNADIVTTYLNSSTNKANQKAESFTALMNLAKYQRADENNETFRTDMYIEIDGKTNGVILSMLQYADGADREDLIARLGKGGIYAGDYANFNEFKRDGNKDAYEEIADIWMKSVQRAADAGNMNPKAFRGAQYIFGLIDLVRDETGTKVVANQKGERNLAKSPLMVTNYGSGDQSVQESLAENFIARVYEMINDNPENYDFIARAVNAIVPNSLSPTTGMPLEETINPENVNKIKNFIIDQFGGPVSDAINARYANTKAGQKAVNDTLDLMYRMHSAVRNDLIDKATKQAIASGEVVEGITTLSAEKMAEIEEQIKVLSPQIKTFYSKANTDFNHNMSLAGSRTATKADSGAYLIDAQYKEGGSYVTGQTNIKVPSAPGVAGGVTTIHSLDALIMSELYGGDVDVIGVHDAILVGLGDAQQGGEALNRATYNAMKSMTIPVEVLHSYDQARKAFAAYSAREDVDSKALAKDFYNAGGNKLSYRKEEGKTVFGREAMNNRLADIRRVAERSLKLKDEVLNTPNLVVHQYADELGATAVTFNETAVEAETQAQKENIGKEAARSTEEVFHEAMYHANNPSQEGVELGSSSINETVSPSQYDSTQVVDATNVQEVFDNLPNTGGKQENDAHKAVLRERINHFGSFIMNPFRLHMRTKEDAPNYGVMTDSDIFITNLAEGAPVTSSMLARGIQMSNEEVMAHELNHLVYLEGLSKDSQERRQVERMFLAARDQLDYTVFLNNPNAASEAEIEGAKATFNHMFFERSGQSLAEFAAFGTTNERFMNALENVQLKPSKIFKGTIGEIFRNILNTLVDIISNRVLGLKGLSSDRKLVKLLDNMHRVNAKKRHGFLLRAEKAALTYQQVISKPVDLVANAVKKALTSKTLLNNRYSVISGTAQFLKASQDERATAVMRKGFNEIRDNVIGTRNGFFVTTMDEIIGRTKGNAEVRDLARAANIQLDQQRKQVKTAMTDNINQSFLTEMSDEDWVAVSKVFLKGDINRLLGLGLGTIQELINSPVALDNMISQLESQLVGNVNANFYLRQARNLGYYMVNGKSREKVALLNAHNIAKVFGNPSVRVSDAAAANVEPIIDSLATLHAMKEMHPEHLSRAGAILTREMAANPDNNGISAVLMAHAALKVQSEQQFSSKAEYKALAIKGWTKEVYKSGVGLETATAREHADLIAQGYIRGARIPNDPADPVQEPRWIYYAPDGALAPYMSTIVSLTNDVAKGSNRQKVNEKWGATNPRQAGGVDTLQINKSKINAMKEMNARPNGPTGASTENYMIPIVNPKGEIVDWRYMMSEDNKDNLLQKDNNAAEILGSMAGNIVDKVESAKVNHEVVKLTKKYWDAEKDTRSKAYVKIGLESVEPRYREIWHQLPEAMREDIRNVWGENAFMVRADLVNHFFGYRKYSLTEMFQKDPEARKWYERMVVDFMTALVGEKAARHIRTAENFLQAVTQEVKDVVIVKSGIVTISNMLSNTMLLVMNGMSPARALRYQYEAYRNSSEMIKEQRQVKFLTSQLTSKSLSATDRRRKEAEIARLNRRISQNPTYQAYAAGLMPTIVEDVAADTEFTNTMRGKAQRAVSEGIDNKLGFTASWFREGVKSVIGLPDTELYKFMNNMVMQSDFVARYAILKHWEETNNVKPGDTQWNSLVGEAEELFVNFDAPTHKGLQYLNDIGIAWFSKYVLRVNRAIARTFVKNPTAAALAVIGVEASGIGIDNPAGSSVFGGGDITRIIADPLSKAIDATDLAMTANLIGLGS